MPSDYVADTHAIAYYLADKLPSEADQIFKRAEEGLHKIYVPSISIAELIYIFEKTKTTHRIWDMFERLDLTPNLIIYPLDVKVLRKLPDIKLAELHDRIVVATCLTSGADTVLTKDKEIKSSKLVKTTW